MSPTERKNSRESDSLSLDFNRDNVSRRRVNDPLLSPFVEWMLNVLKTTRQLLSPSWQSWRTKRHRRNDSMTEERRIQTLQPPKWVKQKDKWNDPDAQLQSRYQQVLTLPFTTSLSLMSYCLGTLRQISLFVLTSFLKMKPEGKS